MRDCRSAIQIFCLVFAFVTWSASASPRMEGRYECKDSQGSIGVLLLSSERDDRGDYVSINSQGLPNGIREDVARITDRLNCSNEKSTVRLPTLGDSLTIKTRCDDSVISYESETDMDGGSKLKVRLQKINEARLIFAIRKDVAFVFTWIPSVRVMLDCSLLR